MAAFEPRHGLQTRAEISLSGGPLRKTGLDGLVSPARTAVTQGTLGGRRGQEEDLLGDGATGLFVFSYVQAHCVHEGLPWRPLTCPDGECLFPLPIQRPV